MIDLVKSHQCLLKATVENSLSPDRLGAQATVNDFALGNDGVSPLVCINNKYDLLSRRILSTHHCSITWICLGVDLPMA